jgi:hypothetical protein
VLLVSVLAAGLLAILAPLPIGVPLARALAVRLICAVNLSDGCGSRPALVDAYGPDLAAAVRDHAPAIVYERGMRALPVDFRRCRSAACADGSTRGPVWRSASGAAATAFVHVIDCRPSPIGINEDGRCGGRRAGNLYLQYWLYYPDSATLRGVPVAGAKGFHRDDWESYQVRVDSAGAADARASSHRGYNYQQGAGNWASDAGIGSLNAASEALGFRNHGGWGTETGGLFVSGGSHAGNVKAFPSDRYTPAAHLDLVPLEPLVAGRLGPGFAIAPPWRKQVWSDPEADGTG